MGEYSSEKLVFTISSNKSGGAKLISSEAGEIDLARFFDFAFHAQPDIYREAILRFENKLSKGDK